VTIFGNFGTPSISQQRLKVKIRNLECRMIVRCAIVKKMKIWVKRGHRLSRDHFGEFLDPLNISATVEARNLKLGMQNDCEMPYR